MSSARARSESGAVVVMVAALMPVIVLLLAFAVDASHWWVHKAHLQTQVDAGVWAGAQGPWLPACDNNAIEQTARQYSGDYSGNYVGPDPTYNDQYSNETNVHVLVNADDGDGVPDDGDYESTGGIEYADGGTPCESFAAGDGHLDLRASEKDLPNFLGSIPGFSVLPWTSDLANAHARVELRQITSSSGALPVAVPDPNPVAGAAFFIDEADGTILSDGRHELSRGAIQTMNGRSLVEWITDPATVTVREKTGVVIAFSGNANWNWQSGDLLTVCSQPLVECYQGLDEGPHKGLAYVHGYPRQFGSGANIVTVGDVQVTNSTCGNDSAPYYVIDAGCTVGFKAQVEFPALSTQREVAVSNSDMGCSGGQPPGCDLTLGADGYWTGSGVLNVPTAGGALDLQLNWRFSKPKPGGPISAGAVVARVYSASEDPLASGPVEYLRVYDSDTSVDKHSTDTAPNDFIVRVGIQGNLEYAQGVSDPIVKLRVIGGSQNQSLDCDPNYPNLADELAFGCRPRYAINPGVACPANRNALWTSPPAWLCVAVQTGTAKNQVPKGMNLRVLGEEQPNSCPPAGEFGHNNWNLNGDSVPDYLPGDPRLLFTFVTPFGSFTGSGEDVKPVTNFAMFYVTGWTGQGQGFANPCENAGDDPSPGPAYIVGHFVKYAGPIEGGEGEDPCVIGDPAVIAPCVAVLTD